MAQRPNPEPDHTELLLLLVLCAVLAALFYLSATCQLPGGCS